MEAGLHLLGNIAASAVTTISTGELAGAGDESSVFFIQGNGGYIEGGGGAFNASDVGNVNSSSWPKVTAVANCSNPLEDVDWSQPGLIISLVILGVVNVLVLAGNCLVVLAVFLDAKLRTVTNLFIVSLAMADLSVGLAVLPFSALLEVLDLWIFGEIWCSIWLAVDVWMCTASILNLCAISLDRYLAVTRPVSYPSIMTPLRAKILLAVVWLLSFLICFPPLVGWNDRKNNRHPNLQHCDDWSCELTNDPGYVVYSALGSFFIPMLVMLFFYWRIYRAAVETTKAINQGFRTTKVSVLLLIQNITLLAISCTLWYVNDSTFKNGLDRCLRN